MNSISLSQKPLALIIEDDDDAADIFTEALQEAELETEVIKDGLVALHRLKTTIPAIIALDLHLPHLSGKDILSHIRSDTRLVNTKVLVVTADPRMSSSLQDKVDLVLIKPISFTQLRDLAKRFHPNWQPGSFTKKGRSS